MNAITAGWKKTAVGLATCSTTVLFVLLLAGSASTASAPGAPGHAAQADVVPAAGQPPNVVLLTLDTTRADFVGAYGATPSRTPTLDGLAARGVRYSLALSPCPMTLPAHASLMTGLDPPWHGIRDNGATSLAPDVPTLASILAEHGYSTGAFVASRVLDRRFGLDRGFDEYDDSMLAEMAAGAEWPQRSAAAVTDAALSWVKTLRRDRPYFLWVHYYDPHSPYNPPGAQRGWTVPQRYAGEIAYMDREIGRLLAALPVTPRARVVAAVGDHGESLGEHGEMEHGIFLYRSTLHVPLIVSGPGVPEGAEYGRPVAIKRIAATLLELCDLGAEGARLGAPLPGVTDAGPAPKVDPIYGETEKPANAYAWSPLAAITDEGFRYVKAPQPELYDLTADPREERNLVARRPDVARRLAAALEEYLARAPHVASSAVELDPELTAALRSLGYVSGPTERVSDNIDPKVGVRMRRTYFHAMGLRAQGRAAAAVALLKPLLAANPHNTFFLSGLGSAQLDAGQVEAAVATWRRAVDLAPERENVHLGLAMSLHAARDIDGARRELREVIAIDPQDWQGWMFLADLELEAGNGSEARRLLREAIESRVDSIAIMQRLAELETEAGNLEAAEALRRQAAALASEHRLQASP